MTTASSAFQTMTRVTAAQMIVDGDSDEDSVMSSQSYTDTDEDDESIDALIKRYTSTCLELNQTTSSEEDDSDRNTTSTDDYHKAVLSKPLAWIKEQQFEAPEFDQRLRGYTEICTGESVTFVAQYRAHPAPTVKWFKDDQEVCAAERHLLESSSSEFEGIIRLTVNDVRTTDEGAYKCKVENQEGVASTTGYLSVSGGGSRPTSRTAARTTSSRNGKLSPGSTISSPSRSPGVSTPPALRPIAEQKSIEEKEELELSRQPPSPLQAFIDSIRHSAKSRHPPIFYGYEVLFGGEFGENDDYDVFDSEGELVSSTTSIDCLEQLVTMSPTSTGDDVEVCESPTRVARTFSASSTDFGDAVSTATNNELSKSATESLDLTLNSFDDIDTEFNGRDNLHCSQQFRVRDSAMPSNSTSMTSAPELKTTEFEPSRSMPTSTCHQRRLRQLQLKHRLAIDLPDIQSSMTKLSPVCPDETRTSYSRNEMAYDSGFSDALSISSSSTFGCSELSTPTDSNVRIGIGNVLQAVQDSILTLIESPVVQFYIVFVAVTTAIANIFDVQPPWLVFIVTVMSFASFQLFGHRLHHPHREQQQQQQQQQHQDYDISYTHCSTFNTHHQMYSHNPCSVAKN